MGSITPQGSHSQSLKAPEPPPPPPPPSYGGGGGCMTENNYSNGVRIASCGDTSRGSGGWQCYKYNGWTANAGSVIENYTWSATCSVFCIGIDGGGNLGNINNGVIYTVDQPRTDPRPDDSILPARSTRNECPW